MTEDKSLILWQNPGWGSSIIEMQAGFYGLPLRLELAGDTYDAGPLRDRLAAVNPLMQIPTLILPDGQVMTESAAITLLLADLTGNDALVPAPGDADRAGFLRWLIYLVAAIYPTHAFGDNPDRHVPKDQADTFQQAMFAERKRLWQVVEAEAARRGGPWFLGPRLSAIDLYFAAMVHWRPRQDWFARHCPNVFASGSAAARLPGVEPAYLRNFG